MPALQKCKRHSPIDTEYNQIRFQPVSSFGGNSCGDLERAVKAINVAQQGAIIRVTGLSCLHSVQTAAVMKTCVNVARR